MPLDTKTVKPLPLTPQQEVASRIAAAIFAGPQGEAILEADDAEVMKQVARASFQFAALFFAAESAS